MSEQIAPLTYESVLALIQRSGLEFRQWLEESSQKFDKRMEALDQKFQETAERQQKTDEQIEKTTKTVEATNKAVGALTDRVGNMVEKMVGEGNLVDQFRALGHNVKTHSRKRVFGEKGTSESGEIDLFMEDGDVAILVEAKTTLKMDDVIDHLERMEKYRRFVDANGHNGKIFIGAVAGTVIAENVMNFAYENGLYVIIQSARAVEILPPPAGFVAKKW
ncbi:MAG: hypothetical protein FWC43_13995 [Planctomycetaceae bacterium]|nr:hypothetical protein [Planctomycetaceae bacterium]